MLTSRAFHVVAVALVLFLGFAGIATNGLTLAFSTNFDPGGGKVGDTAGFFKTLTGNDLSMPGNGRVLTILFSSTVDSITFDFADNGGAPLFLDAYEGGTFVGMVDVTPTVPTGFIAPEGVLSFSGVDFNKVVLSTTAPVYDIDNLDVGGAAVTPEPATLFLLGVGIAGLLARRRKLAA